MTKWVAVSWDQEQILLLSAQDRKGKAIFDQAVVAPLTVESQTKPYAVEIRKTLKQIVQDNKLAKSDVLFILPRSAVELRMMTFPLVPDDEIPEMAKFVAGKEFTEFDLAMPFDIFPLGIAETIEKEKKNVLGATFSRAKLSEITNICTESGLNLKHVVLGPIETASLYTKNTQFAKNETQLLLEFHENSATLTIIFQGLPFFIRSADLRQTISSVFENQGENSCENGKWLISEIKKTTISGLQKIPVKKIDRIFISGDSAQYQKLAEFISTSLETPASTVSPWNGIVCAGELKKAFPPQPEQFAPLIAAVQNIVQQKSTQIDFQNPRKKKEPPQQKKRTIVTVMLAFLLFLGLLGYGYQRRTTLEQQVKALETNMSKLEQEVLKSEQKKRQMDTIANWKKSQIFWPEELQWLSTKVPTAEDTILTSLQLSANNGTGIMKFQGNVKTDKMIPIAEDSLSDDRHRLTSPKISEVQNAKGYPYQFDMTVTITPQTPVLTSTKVPANKEVVK